MKNLDGRYYVEVKDHRYRIQPKEKIILGLKDEPKPLRTQYHVQNERQIRRNQKVIRKDIFHLVVENYPKNKQSIIQQQKFQPAKCPSCRRIIWVEFDEG